MKEEKQNKNPIPQGNYAPATRYGTIIFTAGMTPRNNGVLLMEGKVSASQPIEYYRQAVRQAAQNALTAARNMMQEGETLAQIMSMTVYVNAEEGFNGHSKIADLASEYLCEEMGERGIAARAAVGVFSLPGEAPVEIQMVAALEKF